MAFAGRSLLSSGFSNILSNHHKNKTIDNNLWLPVKQNRKEANNLNL